MKALYNISLSDYISLCCGDNSVVVENGENPSEKELNRHINGMFFEYKMIVSPSGVRGLLYEADERLKTDMSIQLCHKCMNLLKMGLVNDARDIFIDASGTSSLANTEDEDTISEAISYKIKELEFLRKRREFYAGQKAESVQEIPNKELRGLFAREKAFVMTYFKMSIDSDRISAMEYANMVAQADRELKAIQKI